MSDENQVESLARAMYEVRGNGDWPHIPRSTQIWYADLARAALAHLNPKPPEPKDEWREAILEVFEDLPLEGGSFEATTDAILAAIAPLREALEKAAEGTDIAQATQDFGYEVAAEWRDKYEAEKKISAQWAKAAGEWKEKAERLAKAVVDATANTP
jgi:hypothetical protein